LAVWCTGNPLIDTLLKKLDSLSEKHLSLAHAHKTMLESQELREGKGVVSARNRAVDDLNLVLAENVMLRMENLERWGQICELVDKYGLLCCSCRGVAQSWI
jgi:hypothetical protein